MARTAALIACLASAAAQYAGPAPFFASARVEFRVDDSVIEAGDLEQAMDLAAPSLSTQGLVVMRREGAPPEIPTSLLSLLGGFPGFSAFPPATTEYVVRTYDDDDAAEVDESSPHDFGCPCGQDVAALCADTADDGLDAFRSVFEKRLCLANAPGLSPQCAAHLQGYPTVVEWCARDITQNCAGVPPGDNRIHTCLAALPSLESGCAEYLSAVSPVAGLEAPGPSFVHAAGHADEDQEDRQVLEAFLGMASEAFKAIGLVDSILRQVASQPADQIADDAPSDEWLAFDEVPADALASPRQAAFARLGKDGPRLHQSEEPRQFLGADGHGVYRGPEPRHHVGADGHGVYRGEHQDHVRAGDKYYALDSNGVDIVGKPEDDAQAPPVNPARATKLAAFALALGMASGLLASVLLVSIVRTALRKKREREAAEEFKQKFAPLLAEAPLEKA